MKETVERYEMGMGITVRFVAEQLTPSRFNSVILKKVISIAVAAAEKEVLSRCHATNTDVLSSLMLCDDTRYLGVKPLLEHHFSSTANMGTAQSHPK